MRFNSIQFLRAIAAILVVYQHFVNQEIKDGYSWQQNFYHLNKIGAIGVDLFFVISGFIIMHAAHKETGLNRTINFLAKRFCRINPIYYIVSIIYLMVLWYVQKLGFDAPRISSLSKLINSLSDTIIIFPVGDVYQFSPLLTVGWTLSFEWMFYILFCILILFKIKFKPFYLTGLIALLVGIGQIFKPLHFPFSLLTNAILLEFLSGAILYWFYSKINWSVFLSVSCIIIGLVWFILLGFYGYGKIWLHMTILNGELSLNRVLLFGIPSSLIVAGCVFLEKNKKYSEVWQNKLAMLTGDASYSIYLIHPIMYALILIVINKTGYFLPVDVMIIIQTFIAVLAGIGFYIIVEKPLLKTIRTNSIWSTTIKVKNKSVSYE